MAFEKTHEHDLLIPSQVPLEEHERSVSSLGLTTVVIGMAVQVTVFAILGPMTVTYSMMELLMMFIVGSSCIALLWNITQDIGLKYGISFPVSVSATFGYKGAKIVSIIRLIPALIFFATNGFVGAQALNEVFKICFSFDNVYVALAINVVALVAVTINGVKGIERVSTICLPLLIIVGIYMMYVLLDTYNVSVMEMLAMKKTGTEESKSYLYGICVVIGFFSSVLMGANDITKDCKIVGNKKGWFSMNKSYILAAIVGMIPFLTFYCILTCATVMIAGSEKDVMVALSELIQGRSVVLALIIQIFIVVAQLSTNTAANLLPNAIVLSNLFKKLSYKKAVIVAAVVATLFQPWNYMDKLNFVITLFTATAGPAMGIIAIDYYVFRKRRLNVSELYKSKGIYKYTHGFNIAAVVAYVIGTGISVVFFLDIAFFVGTIVSMAMYYFLAKAQGKKYPITTSPEIE